MSDRCPCGGIIYADTEEWETPLCYSCFYETDIIVLEKRVKTLKSQNAELIAAIKTNAKNDKWAIEILRKIKGEVCE